MKGAPIFSERKNIGDEMKFLSNFQSSQQMEQGDGLLKA
jgi:hypothetical protein